MTWKNSLSRRHLNNDLHEVKKASRYQGNVAPVQGLKGMTAGKQAGQGGLCSEAGKGARSAGGSHTSHSSNSDTCKGKGGF